MNLKTQSISYITNQRSALYHFQKELKIPLNVDVPPVMTKIRMIILNNIFIILFISCIVSLAVFVVIGF